MKRLLSWLLALVMILSCLPLSALPAFAVENDVETEDGNDDFVTEFDKLTEGMETNPIDLTADLLNEEDFTATVTVPAGKTLFYKASRVAGMNMTINDGEAVVCTGDNRTPYVWSIKNDTDADAKYVIKVGFPAGTLENPAELEINWDNEADIKAGSQGYYYTWTADAAGTLIVTMPEGDWSYVINNLTTYKYGDQQWSDSDPVVNPAYVTVAEGDEIQLIVNNYDPENEFNAPAGVLTFRADLNNEFNGIPVFNKGQTETVTVPAGFTLYYQAYINGMMLTIDGGEPQLIKTANPRMPYVFALTEGEHTLSIAYPVGTMENPAQLVIGDNAAQIEAGNTMGYFYNYTVEKNGTLVLDIDAGEAGWTYAIHNLTTGVYGDTQWSDSDPVVDPAEIEVVAGEELQIIVNTYDPADMWGNPAGTVTVNASYKPEGPIADPSLKFAKVGLSLQDYIGFTFALMNNVTTGYDKVYVELNQTTPEGVVNYTLGYTTVGPFSMYAHNVQSWSMTEELEVTIYGLKGDQLYIGQSFVTSVRDQALSTMPSADAKTKRVIVDMLTYGAAVQAEFGYNTEKLANAGLDQLGYDSFGTTTIPTLVDNSSTSGTGSYTVATKGLSLQARVDLTLMFTKGDMSAYEAHIAFADTTDVVKGSTFSELAPGAPMRILSLSFAPYRLRENFTVTIHEISTGNVVSPAYTMSVENIAKSKLGQDDGVDAIIYALMNYGDAVLELMG